MAPRPLKPAGPTPTENEAGEALRQRNITSATRARVVLIALALLFPAGLFALFDRQNDRLSALADHGAPASATLVAITRQGSGTYSNYAYEVGGERYDWSVSRSDAPFAVGEVFPITVLAEDPSLSRPGVYTRARRDAEVNMGLQRGFLIGSFAFFALFAGWCHVSLRRLRAGAVTTATKIAPRTMGLAFATIFMVLALATNLDPKVAEVQSQAFGPAFLGLPTTLSFSLVEALLLSPLFWVMPNLMEILMSHGPGGAAVGKAAVLMAVVRAGPEHGRNRAIVALGSVYFVLLLAAWIAFAAYRGV